jgi:hypothetical protein
VEEILDDGAVEKLLTKDWSSGLRLTTVPQAMGRLGIADDIDSRWCIANNLYGHWQSSLGTAEKVQEVASVIGLSSASDIGALSQSWLDQVGSWGRAPILLTENEKLVARHLWTNHLQGQRLPLQENIALALDIPEPEVDTGIRLLTRLGFLSPVGDSAAGSYTMAEDAYGFLDGLGFTFHTVTLDDDEQFRIP